MPRRYIPLIRNASESVRILIPQTSHPPFLTGLSWAAERTIMTHSSPASYLVWSVITSLVRGIPATDSLIFYPSFFASWGLSWSFISGHSIGSNVYSRTVLSGGEEEAYDFAFIDGIVDHRQAPLSVSWQWVFSFLKFQGSHRSQYSYLVTVPMILTYALGNTIIKYHEGFIAHPTHGSQFPLSATF